MKVSSADHHQDRPHQRQQHHPEDLPARGAVHRGRFVQIPGNRVEVALGEPGIGAQGAAQVDQEETAIGVQPEGRDIGAELLQDQEERHHVQEVREDLNQQDGLEQRAAGAEVEAREGSRPPAW